MPSPDSEPVDLELLRSKRKLHPIMVKTIAPQKHRFLNLLEMAYVIQQKRPYLLMMDEYLLTSQKCDSSAYSWKNVRETLTNPHKWMIFGFTATLYVHLNKLLGSFRSNGGFVSLCVVDYLNRFQSNMSNLTPDCFAHCQGLLKEISTPLKRCNYYVIMLLC